MAHSPSKRWEDGVLVERAIDTNRGNAGAREEVEATATKPYKTPNVTPRSPEDKERYAEERPQVIEKAVQEAENKAIVAEETKKPRKRAAKK